VIRARCILCGADASRTIRVVPPFRIGQCLRCGLRYTAPQPEPQEAAAYYGEDYEESNPARRYGIRARAWTALARR
jgi:hypothetical protein